MFIHIYLHSQLARCTQNTPELRDIKKNENITIHLSSTFKILWESVNLRVRVRVSRGGLALSLFFPPFY